MAKRKSDALIVWQRVGTQLLLGARCAGCNGLGRLFPEASENPDCEHCGGRGWFGLVPELPVSAPGGTPPRIAMMTVRYASGLPLWNERDGETISTAEWRRHLEHQRDLAEIAHAEAGKPNRGRRKRAGKSAASLTS